MKSTLMQFFLDKFGRGRGEPVRLCFKRLDASGKEARRGYVRGSGNPVDVLTSAAAIHHHDIRQIGIEPAARISKICVPRTRLMRVHEVDQTVLPEKTVSGRPIVAVPKINQDRPE